jgi:hypothetical protein
MIERVDYLFIIIYANYNKRKVNIEIIKNQINDRIFISTSSNW